MNAPTLSIVNVLLFLLQVAINVTYSRQLINIPKENQTLITPGLYAFSILILIYVLEAMLCITDLIHAQNSFFAEATRPNALRLCFALTCIMNVCHVLFYAKHYIIMATITLSLLWMFLSVLYVYAKNNHWRRSGSGVIIPHMDYFQYVSSELPIAMYFAWVSGMLITQVALAVQHTKQSFLPLSSYVVQLSILWVIACATLIYAHDLVFSITTVWYLAAIGLRRLIIPNEFNVLSTSVHACAGEGALALSMLILITVLVDMFTESDSHNARSGMNIPVYASVPSDYGATQ